MITIFDGVPMINSVKFFDYPLQFDIHKVKYMEIIEDVLSRGAYILGEDLDRFEENLAAFCKAKHAVGISNGTDAILLSLFAAGIGPGDEVISVSHTFVATIEVIKLLGAEPVLVDITDDHNMDVSLVEQAITPKTKALVPVHLNGKICNGMDILADIADKNNLVIIEDAAQSLGATYKGKSAGTFGLTGCFSFYPAKSLGTFGDAGGIVTDDDDFAHKLRKLRNHGRNGAGVIGWGMNCRMDNLHAALLYYKLTLLPDWIERRREIADIYRKELADVPEIVLPVYTDDVNGYNSVYQNFEIEAENRDGLIDHLSGKGIQTPLPWGGKAVHQFDLPGLGGFELPRTEQIMNRAMLLPLYPELSDDHIVYVSRAIKEYYHES